MGRIKKRRGIAEVVGILLFMVLMLSAFAAFILMMENSTEFLASQLKISQLEIDKIKEKFIVSACSDSDNGNRLKVFVENVGNGAVEIHDIWVINKTDSPYVAQLINVTFQDSFIPIGAINDILENQVITMDDDHAHETDIKVVSKLGNSETISLPISNIGHPDERLQIRLIPTPPEISNAANVTLVMNLHNRGNHTLYDVRPIGSPTVTPESVSIQFVEQVPPISIKRLDPNEDVDFIFNYKLFGPVGSKMIFNGTAKAKLCETTTTFDVLSPINYTVARMTFESTVSSLAPQEPFAKPHLFIAAPTPFGHNAGDPGYFAAVVANPTNQTMIVTQVSFLIQNPGASSVIKAPLVDSTSPDGIGAWTITAGDNVFFWKDTTTGVKVPPFSAETWWTGVESSAPTGGPAPIEPFLVNVYTSFGSTTEEKNVGSNDKDTAVLSVYLNTEANGSGDRIYDVKGLLSDQTARFNFTMFNNGDGEDVRQKSFFLITIPAGFTIIEGEMSVSDSSIFTVPLLADFIVFDDGSQMIPINVTGAAGIVDEAVTFSAAMELPTVAGSSMYIFRLNTNGTSDAFTGDDTVNNAFAETVIQVCLTTDCN